MPSARALGLVGGVHLAVGFFGVVARHAGDLGAQVTHDAGVGAALATAAAFVIAPLAFIRARADDHRHAPRHVVGALVQAGADQVLAV